MHILRLRGQGLWLLRVLSRTYSPHGQPKPLLLVFDIPGCAGRAIVISQSPEKLIQLDSVQVRGLMAWDVSLACLGHQGKGLIPQAVISKSAYSPGDSYFQMWSDLHSQKTRVNFLKKFYYY